MDPGGDVEKRDVRRPMNAFLIFCKRHRSIVREKNPDLDNRSVTRILGDLWANLKDNEKVVYTDLAKQYKDAFMKANPDYKWHNPEKTASAQKMAMPKPTNVKVIRTELEVLPEGSIMPGKLADPSNMGGLSLLLIAGQQSDKDPILPIQKSPVTMETRESDTDPVSPPVNKVKWDEERFTRTVVGEPVIPKQKDDTTVKLEQQGTKYSTPTMGESGRMRSETSVNTFMSFKTEAGLTNMKTLVPETDLCPTLVTKPEIRAETEPVWRIDGKKTENHFKPNTQTWKLENLSKEKETTTRSLMALAEMCDDKSLPISITAEMPGKPLLYQAVAAPKVPQRSLLAEAFLDTCDKGSYSDVLRDNSSITKITKGENNFKCHENDLEKFDSRSEFDEKENISKLIVKDVKDCKEGPDEESPMITCGKLVVNHIIDRLFSSDIAAAARKVHSTQVEKMETKEAYVNNGETIHSGVNTTGTPQLNSYSESFTTSCENGNVHKDAIKQCSKNGVVDFDEHDGIKDSMGKHGDKKNLTSEESSYDEYNDRNNTHKYDEHVLAKSMPETDVRSDNSPPTKCPSPPSEVRDEEMGGEGELEDSEDYQPVRKSRRRNRGQRYQELINEGIIQPSKERMAALKQDTPKEECAEEDFQSIDSYILPETAIRRIRKRTTSESAKDKILPLDDAKRYKTGDFDLEAHIATLPACPVESMGRKRGFVRQRHHSESTHMKKQFEEPNLPVFDIKKAVSLPPHVKIPSPEKTAEPVIGSRKRKARKHSITHLLPAPPSLISNGNESLRDYRTNSTASESSPVNDKSISDHSDDKMVTLQCETATEKEHQVASSQQIADGNNDNKPQNDWEKQNENKNIATGVNLESENTKCETDGAAVGQNSSVSENRQSYEQTDSKSHVLKDGVEIVTQSYKNGGDTEKETVVFETQESFSRDQNQTHLKNNDETEGITTNAVLIGNHSESDHSFNDTASNIPGDQSSIMLQEGQRPPVHGGQNCRSEMTNSANMHCLDTGYFNQRAATDKEKDMNFNTKVHC